MPFVGSHGGVGGAVAAFAPGGGSAVVHMIRAAVFFPGDPAGRDWRRGGCWSCFILVAVLGFLASEDEDLPEVSLL